MTDNICEACKVTSNPGLSALSNWTGTATSLHSALSLFLKEQSLPLAMIHSVSGAFWTVKSKKFFHKSLNDSFLIMFHSHISVCLFFMLFLLRSRRSSSPASRRREWSWGRCSQIPTCRSDVDSLHVLDSSHLHSTYNPFRRTSALDTY